VKLESVEFGLSGSKEIRRGFQSETKRKKKYGLVKHAASGMLIVSDQSLLSHPNLDPPVPLYLGPTMLRLIVPLANWQLEHCPLRPMAKANPIQLSKQGYPI
jgi:hypothetical protein